jgi:hypothetical protein
MPDKIFVISLHRVMTRSTDALISMLGFRTVHYPEFFRGWNLMEAVRGFEDDPNRIVDVLEPIIQSADAFSDIPIPTLYRQLAERWPTSRFVLVHRDPAGWVSSVRKHVGSKNLSPYNRIQYGHYLGTDIKNLLQVTDEQLVDMYFRHLYEVYDYFHEERREPERLCMVCISNPSIGERIAGFLGHEPLPMPRIANRPSPDELEAAHQWVQRCPDKVDARFYLARNLIAVGDREGAKAQLRHACQVDPDYPGPYMLLSELLAQEGKRIDAGDAAAHALRAGLRGPRLYYRAAAGRLLQMRLREALSFGVQGFIRKSAS